ncbi:hypothetical protein BH10BAC5_BH10BAC5_24400 [soil metagenome]
MLCGLLLILFSFKVSFCQENSQLKNDSLSENLDNLDTVKYPIFFPHFAAGIVSGLRYGLIVQFVKHFSVEFSNGQFLGNFVGLSEIEKQFGFGFSYHLSKTPLFLSTLIVIGTKIGEALDSPKYSYSINVGYIKLTKYHVQFFFRVGIGLKYTNNKYFNKISFERVLPNLDVGLGFAF